MASHGEEITEKLYQVCDWSWTGHGTAPATAVVYSKNEGYPIEYIDRGERLPALFFVKEGGWPSIVHYPNHTTETYRLSIYAVDKIPTTGTGYVETAIRSLIDNVVTNMIASTNTDVAEYALTGKMDLPYVEDVRWIGTEVRDDIQEFIEAMGLQLISARADFEIYAHGTRR